MKSRREQLHDHLDAFGVLVVCEGQHDCKGHNGQRSKEVFDVFRIFVIAWLFLLVIIACKMVDEAFDGIEAML